MSILFFFFSLHTYLIHLETRTSKRVREKVDQEEVDRRRREEEEKILNDKTNGLLEPLGMSLSQPLGAKTASLISDSRLDPLAPEVLDDFFDWFKSLVARLGNEPDGCE